MMTIQLERHHSHVRQKPVKPDSQDWIKTMLTIWYFEWD